MRNLFLQIGKYLHLYHYIQYRQSIFKYREKNRSFKLLVHVHELLNIAHFALMFLNYVYIFWILPFFKQRLAHMSYFCKNIIRKMSIINISISLASKHSQMHSNQLKDISSIIWTNFGVKHIQHFLIKLRQLAFNVNHHVVFKLTTLYYKGVYRNKCRGGQDLREAQKFFLPPPRSS